MVSPLLLVHCLDPVSIFCSSLAHLGDSSFFPSSSFLLTSPAHHFCPTNQTPSYSPVLHIWSQTTAASAAGGSPGSHAEATLAPSALGSSLWWHLHLHPRYHGLMPTGSLSSLFFYLALLSQKQNHFPLILCNFRSPSLTVQIVCLGLCLLLLFSISLIQCCPVLKLPGSASPVLLTLRLLCRAAQPVLPLAGCVISTADPVNHG